jgi:hypothetical protein
VLLTMCAFVSTAGQGVPEGDFLFRPLGLDQLRDRVVVHVFRETSF